ncbi:uncharacterized protein LOC130014678 [Mercurialis annua]|uniref:uncharacterized protein LOC130014680 n=1 Tax=Mercurialis annua TaxID=3986 RepID=UPI0024ADBBCD|nr:uncharacterized protein LOC130014680 [Mercurialis annua]XP_050237631.2 uncharacterized protein LOC130014681 [Mercurialis annua]XP_050237638.2 uncharacterized protein LOC130014679 [Mercurialis annua]XP_050237640.2 uncharacterized protein LOC130014678 [Mercurialis annua]
MAMLRSGMLKAADNYTKLGFVRWAHVAAMPSLLDGSINSVIAPPQMVLPEFNPNSNDLGFGFSSFFSGGSMELMAVPKRKVSPHKRGIRNGPKALKPTPVIVRCRSCGRVKLPHFYCCSGEREKTGEPNN